MVMIYTWRNPLVFYSPCWIPFVPFLCSLYLLRTLLAVTGSVHLGLRLLVNWPPLSQPFPTPSPLQIHSTQVNKRLTMTTSMCWTLRRECVRTLWMGAPSWEEGDRILIAGIGSVSWLRTKEVGRRDLHWDEKTTSGQGRRPLHSFRMPACTE